MTPNRKPELTKQETDGFERFVREHYRQNLLEAETIVSEMKYFDEKGRLPHPILIHAVFEKLASPRVYLIDAWRKLSSEEHMVYTYPDPVEREKARAKAEEISKQAREMIN